MKKTRNILLLGALCLGLAACNTKKPTVTDSPMPSSATSVSEESSAIDALVAEENAIFEANREIWDKVFSHLQEDEAALAEGDYVTNLRNGIEEMREELSEEEIQILLEDCEKVQLIEEQLKKALGVE